MIVVRKEWKKNKEMFQFEEKGNLTHENWLYIWFSMSYSFRFCSTSVKKHREAYMAPAIPPPSYDKMKSKISVWDAIYVLMTKEWRETRRTRRSATLQSCETSFTLLSVHTATLRASRLLSGSTGIATATRAIAMRVKTEVTNLAKNIAVIT